MRKIPILSVSRARLTTRQLSGEEKKIKDRREREKIRLYESILISI